MGGGILSGLLWGSVASTLVLIMASQMALPPDMDRLAQLDPPSGPTPAAAPTLAMPEPDLPPAAPLAARTDTTGTEVVAELSVPAGSEFRRGLPDEVAVLPAPVAGARVPVAPEVRTQSAERSGAPVVDTSPGGRPAIATIDAPVAPAVTAEAPALPGGSGGIGGAVPIPKPEALGPAYDVAEAQPEAQGAPTGLPGIPVTRLPGVAARGVAADQSPPQTARASRPEQAASRTADPLLPSDPPRAGAVSGAKVTQSAQNERAKATDSVDAMAGLRGVREPNVEAAAAPVGSTPGTGSAAPAAEAGTAVIAMAIPATGAPPSGAAVGPLPGSMPRSAAVPGLQVAGLQRATGTVDPVTPHAAGSALDIAQLDRPTGEKPQVIQASLRAPMQNSLSELPVERPRPLEARHASGPTRASAASAAPAQERAAPLASERSVQSSLPVTAGQGANGLETARSVRGLTPAESLFGTHRSAMPLRDRGFTDQRASAAEVTRASYGTAFPHVLRPVRLSDVAAGAPVDILAQARGSREVPVGREISQAASFESAETGELPSPSAAPEAPDQDRRIAQADPAPGPVVDQPESSPPPGQAEVVLTRPSTGFGVRVKPLTERNRGESAIVTGRLPRIGSAQPEPPSQEAAVPRPAAQPVTALERNRAPFENTEEKPLFSVILIDVGAEGLPRETLAQIGVPVTFAVDPAQPNAAAVMQAYADAGFETVLLASGLPEGAEARDVEVTFGAHLAGLPRAIGMMDTDAEILAGDRELMEQTARLLAQDGHGLILRDRGLNTGRTAAVGEGVRTGLVFRPLDADRERGVVIGRYLDRAAFRAAQEGSVIMVGHTYPETVQALIKWALEGKGVQMAMAPVSAVLMDQ